MANLKCQDDTQCEDKAGDDEAKQGDALAGLHRGRGRRGYSVFNLSVEYVISGALRLLQVLPEELEVLPEIASKEGSGRKDVMVAVLQRFQVRARDAGAIGHIIQ